MTATALRPSPTSLTDTPTPAPVARPPAYFERRGPANVILASFAFLTLSVAAMVLFLPDADALFRLYFWLLGGTHVVVTLTVYGSRANRAHFATDRRAVAVFVAAPVLILVAYVACFSLKMADSVPRAAEAAGRATGNRVADGIVGFGIHNRLVGAFPKLHGNLSSLAERAGFKVCFAADMPMRTASGHVLSQDVREGTKLLARDEWDANGAAVEKVVEAVFVRAGLVVEVVVNGVAIRTTAEHPLFRFGDGWTAAHELRPGDTIRLEDGWATVEKVIDTGRWETVYNFRVADYHTYFVGSDEWGWAVWAHNRPCADVAEFESRYGSTVFSVGPPGDRIKKVFSAHADEVKAVIWEAYQMGARGRLPGVLGRGRTVVAFTNRQPTGYKSLVNRLNGSQPEGWNLGSNKAWILGGIDSGRSFRLVSPPISARSMDKFRTGVGTYSTRVYEQEVQLLRNAGYTIPSWTSGTGGVRATPPRTHRIHPALIGRLLDSTG